MKTKAIFKKIVWFNDTESQTEITAIFPTQFYNRKMYGTTLLNSYSHIGQHSSIHKDFLTDSTDEVKSVSKATESEYQNLKTELEQIGYNLEII